MKKFYKKFLRVLPHLQYASLILSLSTLLVQIKFPFFIQDIAKIHISTTLWGIDFFSLHELFLLCFLVLNLKRLCSISWYYFLPSIMFFVGALFHVFLWGDLFSLLKVRYFLEYWLFALCIVHHAHFMKVFWYYLLLGGIFESIVCILQFFLQMPLGIPFLYEAPFSPSQLGSAKILFQDHSLVRAYGTFEHPNITAFFLIGSLAASTRYPLQPKSLQIIVATLLLLALLLTFSKTALTSLIIFTGLLLWQQTKLGKQSFLLGAFLLGASSIPVLLFVFANSVDTFTDRLIYLQQILHIPDILPFFIGHGFGSSAFALLSNQSFHVMPWQLQPIHALLPLLFYEGGLLAASVGGILLIPLLQHWIVKQHQKHMSTLLITTSILVFSLTDHLLLTSHIGLLLFFYTSIELFPSTSVVIKKFFPFFSR